MVMEVMWKYCFWPNHEHARHCCGTCLTAPLNIGFGGPAHGDNNGPGGVVFRPEEWRYSHCLTNDRTTCAECASATNCYTMNAGETHARIQISVNAGQQWTRYIAELHIRCPPGQNAQWKIIAAEISNAQVKLFRNGELVKTMGPPGAPQEWEGSIAPQSSMDVGLFHLEHFPTNRASSSSSRIEVLALKADIGFDNCMDVKSCLRLLGDGGAAGREMRMYNQKQLHCLENPNTIDAHLKAKCTEWRQCLTTNGGSSLIAFLLALLQAGGVPRSSSLLTDESSLVSQRKERRSKQASNSSSGSSECIEPDIEDRGL